MALDPETRRRKTLAQKRLNEKWLWLRDYAPVIAKMVQVGPTNPIEATILREALVLVLAEINFRQQETQELLMEMDPNGGADESGTQGSPVPQ